MKTVLLSIDALLYAVESMIIDIVKDIVITVPKSQTLSCIRQRLYTQLVAISGKNHFFFDVDVERIVKSTIRDRKVFNQYGKILFDAIEDWVATGQTQWDITKISPIIVILKAEISTDNVDDHNAVIWSDDWQSQIPREQQPHVH